VAAYLFRAHLTEHSVTPLADYGGSHARREVGTRTWTLTLCTLQVVMARMVRVYSQKKRSLTPGRVFHRVVQVGHYLLVGQKKPAGLLVFSPKHLTGLPDRREIVRDRPV
jgi:hypothetical protein